MLGILSHTDILQLLCGYQYVFAYPYYAANHEHSDSQYAVIDILSNFQSEISIDFYDLESPFFQLSESFTVYDAPSFLKEAHAVIVLRGPPQA